VTGRPRVTRSTPVALCAGLLAYEPITVAPETDVLEVLRLAAMKPTTRLIGVVDGDGKLVGLIPIRDLVEAVVARLIPEALLIDVEDVDDVVHFGVVVESRTAGDVMKPPATVTPEWSIARAFREIHHRKLSGVYVVDGDGRPIGYLDALELAYLVAEGAPGGPGPAPEAAPVAPPPPDPPDPPDLVAD
jgi:CBS domain-containing protein